MKSSFQELETNSSSWGKNVFDNNITLNGYQQLAIAIVSVAAEDYRKEALKSKHKTYEALAIERFFESDYGELLTFGMASTILEKLRKECGWK